MQIINTHFTRLIKSKERLREFNFRKLPGLTEVFHVDVSDDRGNRLIFKMLKDPAGWKIMEDTLPDWVYATEEKLSEAIISEVSVKYA